MRNPRESLPEPLNSVPWDSAARHCPIRDLLAHLGDKWSMLVLIALAQHPERRLRFSELMSRVRGISQRMLTTTLRYLERDGILTRRLYPEVPPRVEYTLSERGSRLLVPVEAIVAWVQDEWPEIEKSRDEYDKRHGRDHKL
jgi:DNA-binding HxlR family transcriptional regulator